MTTTRTPTARRIARDARRARRTARQARRAMTRATAIAAAIGHNYENS